MFDFTNPTSVVRSYPTMIYWSISGSITLLLVVGYFVYDNPKWILIPIDLIGLNFLKSSKVYRALKKRENEKTKLANEMESMLPAEWRGDGMYEAQLLREARR